MIGEIYMVTYNDIKNDPEVKIYIEKADAAMLALGYTEHCFAHVTRVAETAAYILSTLGFDERTVELAKIAGYLHDTGNLINRIDHSQSSAVIAFRVLDKLGMDPAETATIACAIGNHDEGTGVPVDPVSAALILADKSDVRRTRVRNVGYSHFDIHDRVNYSVEHSALIINDEHTIIDLQLTVDTKISTLMDYFEIFLGRMTMCRRAAERLGLSFTLTVNGQRLA